jgi:hypothetical protein
VNTTWANGLVYAVKFLVAYYWTVVLSATVLQMLMSVVGGDVVV